MPVIFHASRLAVHFHGVWAFCVINFLRTILLPELISVLVTQPRWNRKGPWLWLCSAELMQYRVFKRCDKWSQELWRKGGPGRERAHRMANVIAVLEIFFFYIEILDQPKDDLPLKSWFEYLYVTFTITFNVICLYYFVSDLFFFIDELYVECPRCLIQVTLQIMRPLMELYDADIILDRCL